MTQAPGRKYLNRFTLGTEKLWESDSDVRLGCCDTEPEKVVAFWRMVKPGLSFELRRVVNFEEDRFSVRFTSGFI